MRWRPAFYVRFLQRLPDPKAVRFRWVGGGTLLAATFGLVLVLGGVQLDRRRCEDVAREQALTLARTAGMWLDGDAHVGLGNEPEKRLSDLGATLQQLLEASEYAGVVRTLRPTADAKAALAASPGTPRTAALEVVLQTGSNPRPRAVDYVAAMRKPFFDAEATTVVAAGRVSAYAPVADSWGSTSAIVHVEGPSTAPLWRIVLFGVGVGMIAALLVAFAVWRLRGAVAGLEEDLGALESGARQLAAGQLPGPFALRPGAATEVAALAEALEDLRGRAGGQPPAPRAPAPARPAAPAPAPAPAPRVNTSVPEPAPAHRAQAARPAPPAASAPVDLGEVSDFDLALLLQQLIEPARANAQSRGVAVQLVFPDSVPTQVKGNAMALYRGLEALLGNAMRTTREGSISLRVSRAEPGPSGQRLRFEVADTSPGIAFKAQQILQQRLETAAAQDPAGLKEPLEVAAAVARTLGGELRFESQPGQGSRFSLTATLGGGAPARPPAPPPAAPTAPRPQTTFFPHSPIPLS